MTRFLQIHLLTCYPPSNLNRDDLGRPKTALFGGTNRLRISSQSLKRAWRTSEIFQSLLKDHLGMRTRIYGNKISEQLKAGGMNEQDAKGWAYKIWGQFGMIESGGENTEAKTQTQQLVHLSLEEAEAINEFVQKILQTKKPAPVENKKSKEQTKEEKDKSKKKDEIEEELAKLLKKPSKTVDIAMFGRMLADSPEFNVEAAVQVAHAITVHKVAVEDDYFTAVDDLIRGEQETGAGHIGSTQFGSGLFYLYLCVNRKLLLENLAGDAELAKKAIRALVEAAAKVGPSGKQNSFGSRAYALFGLAEKGNEQPRSLHSAFFNSLPERSADYLARAVEQLMQTCEQFDKVYGPCASGGRKWFDVQNKYHDGCSFNDFVEFCVSD